METVTISTKFQVVIPKYILREAGIDARAEGPGFRPR